MDLHKEQLRNDYEDSLMRMLMDDLAEDEGARLIEENEKLYQDPGSAMPQEQEDACRRAMFAAFDKKDRKARYARAQKVLIRAAVICLAFIFSFSGLYFGVSAFREAVDGLLSKPGETSTIVQTSEEQLPACNYESSVDVPESILLPTWLPDGYNLTGYSSLDRYDRIVFSDNNNREIMLAEFIDSLSGSIDSENADFYGEIDICGNTGLLVSKDGTNTLFWTDLQSAHSFRLKSSSVPLEVLQEIAKSFYNY